MSVSLGLWPRLLSFPIERFSQQIFHCVSADKPGAVLGGNPVGTKAYEIPALSAGRMSGSRLTV